MDRIHKGSALVLGNNIDTDQIYPGRSPGYRCAGGNRPALLRRNRRGDRPRVPPGGGIVVASSNFGCGSSREHAPIALLNMGASVVLADSFARIFFRDAINLGLPLLICKGLGQATRPGEELEVDLLEGIVRNHTAGRQYQAEQLREHALGILEAGGIKPLMRRRMAARGGK